MNPEPHTHNELLASLVDIRDVRIDRSLPMEERVNAIREVIDVTSVPFAVVALGVPDEAPAARGFYDESRVKWL